MERREFLKKFVALSSVSLVMGGCMQPKKDAVAKKKKIKDSVTNKIKDKKKQIPVTDGSQIHPNVSNIIPKAEPEVKVEKSVPMAVYGPPPVH